jgi:hypothetical protein
MERRGGADGCCASPLSADALLNAADGCAALKTTNAPLTELAAPLPFPSRSEHAQLAKGFSHAKGSTQPVISPLSRCARARRRCRRRIASAATSVAATASAAGATAAAAAAGAAAAPARRVSSSSAQRPQKYVL